MEISNSEKQRLWALYGVDVAAAATSSAMVSPLIAVVDRAIIENANGKRPLGQGLVQGLRAIFTQPIQFAGSLQFRLVYGLYFSTYITANVMDTTSERMGVKDTTAAWYKFIATSVVNMGICIYKDRSFTRMFGVTATRALPMLTYFCFAARDSLTIAASFNAPVYFAQWLQQKYVSLDRHDARVIAQLVCPASIQFVSTPIHLLGLDMYNRPTASSAQRMGLIRKEYLKSAFARIGRIGPAFGIGGVGNAYFRGFRRYV
ncbi:hypothetical protein BDB00DRAFT_951076 [Zychaea mexicana]|uniref:uncharacterized protein n=1 Tax=Zychaea mexicana TaxID=64656 RepID=UPI0022FE931E|nr:uncharacterized protein BDB00DRAFT_951076 [Zychaea mexicana]KAI9497999.1 hypothetical protein BDB00DRAFT_951076 [Zychaea mexicana]